jgi:prepilin peptidase CpaA
MLVGIAVLIIPYVLSGMGAGDVKLMGTVGGFLGAKETFEAFILVALAGGIYSLVIMFRHREMFKGFFVDKLMALFSMVMTRRYIPLQMDNSSQKPRLKYGVAIAFGSSLYLILKTVGIRILY